MDPDKYDTVDVTLKFDSKVSAAPITISGIPFDSKKEGIVVPGDQLAAQILAAVGPYFGPEATNPPFPLVTTATQLKFKSSKNLAPDLDRKTANELTIEWIKASQCCDKGGK